MQYRTGTVSANTGNSTVIGVGTAWSGNVSAGDLFIVLTAPTVVYFVANTVSNTEIALTAPYAGSNISGEDYTVCRDFTANGLPMIYPGDVATSGIWNRMVALLDPLV